MPTVGDRIKEIREHRRLTQDRLAEMSNISKGFLSEMRIIIGILAPSQS